MDDDEKAEEPTFDELIFGDGDGESDLEPAEWWLIPVRHRREGTGPYPWNRPRR